MFSRDRLESVRGISLGVISVFAFAFLVAGQPAAAAEDAVVGDGLSVSELVAAGFTPTATGELMISRKITASMDAGIFLMGDSRCRDGERIFMATPTGEQPLDCDFRSVDADYAKFIRMIRGQEEFVCVRYGSVSCYRVTGQKE